MNMGQFIVGKWETLKFRRINLSKKKNWRKFLGVLWRQIIVWIWHENGWLKFKYIGIFETLIFDEKKMISPVWNENILFMNCINISYWVVSSFPIVENFSSTPNSGEEWWSSLGFNLGFYVGFCLTVSYVHLDP